MPTRPRTFVSFGHNLREARLAARLTQDALAQRLGFHRATAISLWERSAHVPEPRTIRKIAAAIGCSAKVLMRNVVTEYDALRHTAIVLTPDEVVALEARQLSDDDDKLLACWRQFEPQTQAKFMALFEHMCAAKLANGVPDGRGLEARLARPPAPSAASPRRRRPAARAS